MTELKVSDGLYTEKVLNQLKQVIANNIYAGLPHLVELVDIISILEAASDAVRTGEKCLGSDRNAKLWCEHDQSISDLKNSFKKIDDYLNP